MKLGDMVIALVNPAANNEADEAPAVVTRVRDDGLVNLKVLQDEVGNTWLVAVKPVGERPAPEDLQEEFPDTPLGHSRVCWPAG